MADIVYPYNDDAMAYDLDWHFYKLKEDYVTNELGEDLIGTLNLADDTKRASAVDRYLRRISRVIYNYIYSHCSTNTKDYVEYLLAKKPEWRKIIQEALEEQLYYTLRNGDLTTYNGIDIYNGTKMQLKREDTISPLASDVLANAGILYNGFYSIPIDFEKVKRSDY